MDYQLLTIVHSVWIIDIKLFQKIFKLSYDQQIHDHEQFLDKISHCLIPLGYFIIGYVCWCAKVWVCAKSCEQDKH